MAVSTPLSTYATVARDDFASQIDITRYTRRSPHFEEIIRRTDEHFWNPEDPDYIDFETPIDEDCTIIPRDFPFELSTDLGDKMDEGEKIAFCRETARWYLSQLLHGEQGAFQLSASLCDMFVDPGAQEYMSNQVREEARHVHAFSKYFDSRFPEGPYPAGDTLGTVLTEIIHSDEVYKKVIGMQIMVEGLAMGAFTNFYQRATDPVLRRLCQLTMTDEAFHHRFGKIWADSAVPEMSEEDRDKAEDWSAEMFDRLRKNLINPYQRKHVYAKFGFEPEYVTAAIMEAVTDDDRRANMSRSTSMFRILVKTIQKAGLISERTQDQYSMWVNLEDLANEGDRMIGDDIAEHAIPELIEIGRAKGKSIIRKMEELG